MKQAAERDPAEDQLYGTETSPVKLPRALGDLKRRQEKLREAMKQLEAMEAERAARGERRDVSAEGPAVPLSEDRQPGASQQTRRRRG